MLHFIYNPIAGKRRSRRCREILEPLLRQSGQAHRFYQTQGRSDATRLVRELTRQDGQNVIAMGGDGTLNEVLNGIVDPATARLGIIPCGSGNDFAAVAGIPDAPEEALELVLRGEAKCTDYLECGGVRGINVIGTGIDVDILRRYSRMKLLRGYPAYLASLVLTLLSFRAYSFREMLDGAPREHRAFIACAGNGQCIGGGIPVCPKAAIDDGLMDIVIVDDIRRTGIPAAFVKLMKRRILELPTTTFRRDSRLCIQSDRPMPIQIDGEIHEELPFDVRVISGKLRIYRP